MTVSNKHKVLNKLLLTQVDYTNKVVKPFYLGGQY